MKNLKVIVGGFMSIDGKAAPANRVGREFSGFMSPRHLKILHEIRATVDAIIVGVDTVIADDPALTVRAVKGKNPMRIILDSHARTPLTSKILNNDEAPTLIVVTQQATKEKITALKNKNVEVMTLGASDRVNLKELMENLKERGIKKILVEGGSEVRWSFFKENLVNEMFVWVMPYVWGGRDAPTLIDGEGFIRAEDAVPLQLKSMETVDDILVLWFLVKQ